MESIDLRCVTSLDVTQADYHSLEGPLINMANDTGGMYRSTYINTTQAGDESSIDRPLSTDRIAATHLAILKKAGIYWPINSRIVSSCTASSTSWPS